MQELDNNEVEPETAGAEEIPEAAEDAVEAAEPEMAANAAEFADDAAEAVEAAGSDEAAAAMEGAADSADLPEPQADGADAPASPEVVAPKTTTIPPVAWAVIAVAALVVGLLIGAFALGGKSAPNSLDGATTVSEDKLDTSVGSFTYDGKTTDLSVRQVIQVNGSLDQAKDDDGNYKVPSADTVLNYARNQVLLADAQAQGISVTDEEVNDYATQAIGTSDIASIAASYGMDEDMVRATLEESCIIQKLRDKVMADGGVDDQAEATAPTEPPALESLEGESDDDSEEAEGDETTQTEGYYDEYTGEWVEPAAESEDEGSEDGDDADADEKHKEYADYIIALAGSEWDAKAGTWASTDGPYATALADFEVTADGATYDAAMAAYYVAYQDYTAAASSANDVWTDYVSALLAKASISINTLVS